MSRLVDIKLVEEKMSAMGISDLSRTSIREITALTNSLEAATGEKYIRMEIGVPGLPVSEIAINAEIEALKSGVAAIYPDINGIPQLKKEASRFLKLFLDADIKPENCVPCVGSMQGGYTTLLTLTRFREGQDTILFVDPGFPVHKQQARVMGAPYKAFDVYNYRGEKLRAKLEEYLSAGNIACILYSNPNNPSWICFTEEELKIIAELCDKYNVVAIEDLAYFGMDFRHDYSVPGQPPYPPTISRYTDNYVLLVSSSKAFSYAGQRMGFIAISDKLAVQKSDNLLKHYNWNLFSRCLIYGSLYALSSGTAHTVQYGFAALLKTANDGTYNFVKEIREYGEKAHIMKKIFLDNGFNIVYDKDGDTPIADGFYFTIAYKDMNGHDLIKNLLCYGISAISLGVTGSEHSNGLRACVSLVYRSQFPDLKDRVENFNRDFSKK
ncbi:MAG: pyridoxal phosphate-dependent aminotransferase [Bacteroidales bacterium]|nr:pyridoxal phosphate-dependent aminotransferase [Bacteroidales bacterium]MDD3914805.1 pyridoxal phosphate-dependent aminotransferase [Bacteroidales bacterium]MDD4634698.1 pyridoxal phosphate-dependent aminotransferase [Bacteroidales bacterium]